MQKIFHDIPAGNHASSGIFGTAARMAPEKPTGSLVRSYRAALPEETLRIATRLRMSLTDSDHSVAITGLTQRDFASELAQGIAVAFSQFSPGQVLLVSAGPEADSVTGAGLAEVLTGECSLGDALGVPQTGGPWLLTPGKMPENRSSLFFAPDCAALITALGQRFRHVVVDTGPLLHSGSLAMIGHCDTVAVALAAGMHHKSEGKQMQSELARVKTRMLGAVLTGKKP